MILEISHAEPVHISEVESYVDKIDIMILCGSATDLPEQGPYLAGMFNTVDSYDNSWKIPEYFAKWMRPPKGIQGKHDFSGWDPGLFSVNRLSRRLSCQGETPIPSGAGVSQGHSDAIRRVPGVKNAVQYTIPVEEAWIE